MKENSRNDTSRLMDLPLEERLRVLGLSKQLEPPTPEELEERRAWGKRVDELRERIGPIDIPVNDLLNMTDEKLFAKYGRKTTTTSRGS